LNDISKSHVLFHCLGSTIARGKVKELCFFQHVTLYCYTLCYRSDTSSWI